MSREQEIEKILHKNAAAIEELSIRIEMLNRQTQELLNELNVSHEQLSAFIENKENFTDENWQALITQRQSLDAKLQLDLSNVRNPLATKKTYQDRHVQPHWLFVR